MQASLSLTAAVSGSSQSHPSIIVKEMPGEKVEVFLVCEQVIISEIAGMEAPLLLLAAYYSYNMQYPKGLSSFFTLLEVKLCGMKPRKVPSAVSNALIALQ